MSKTEQLLIDAGFEKVPDGLLFFKQEDGYSLTGRLLSKYSIEIVSSVQGESHATRCGADALFIKIALDQFKRFGGRQYATDENTEGRV